MINQVLTEILRDQKESFNRDRSLIDRDVVLAPYIKTAQVVVITGVRRCGKSSLLYLIKRQMNLEDSDYCYVNFDDERITKSKERLQQIYLLHVEEYRKEPVFFFDEIQNVPQWEQFVNRMYEKGLKIFLTGSNATLLSSEIASSLTGRNKTLELYPFSFREYLNFRNVEHKKGVQTSKEKSLLRGLLKDYAGEGGFPLVVKERDLDLINQYFQDILYRDIVARYRIVQVNEIKQLALFLISNTGKLFSYSTLQKLAGIKSTQSVKSYVDYLENSFLFYFLRKFDYSVKKQMMNSRKAYVVDTGLCHRLGFSFSENSGRLLENIVLLHLLRNGKEVYYHKMKKECDFVVKEGLKITTAIQVCDTLHMENYIREFDGLADAMDSYGLKKGLLITNSNMLNEKQIPDNVEIVNAAEWLLSK
jgi:predicted AAA+ superfamily ATPase